jgi:hypothetical protein
MSSCGGRWVLLFSALSVGSCRDASSPQAGDEAPTTTEGATEGSSTGTMTVGTTVTDSGLDTTSGEGEDGPFFAEHVAPILATHCWSCHVEGGMAPFSFETYDQAEPLGEAIASMSAGRVMPPWAPDASGACQSFTDARWLADDDITTLQAWVEAGKPAGNLAEVPSPVTPPGLDEVSATITLPGFTPEPSDDFPWDDYRCFLVDAPSASDSALAAFEVHPGVIVQTHHIGLFGIHSDAGVEAALQRDGEDGKPGWTCFGGPGVPDSSVLAAWAPGVPVARFPEGTGAGLEGGRPIVVQVHYNLLQGASEDHTTIDLQLDGSATALSPLVVVDLDLSIPPQTAMHIESTTTTHTGAAVEIMAAFPHMHQLGRELRVSLSSNGQDTCLMDVPRWDFHWQQTYNYAAPIRLDPGDQLELTCMYRSIGVDHVTEFGEGTDDEMCAIVFFTRPAQ